MKNRNRYKFSSSYSSSINNKHVEKISSKSIFGTEVGLTYVLPPHKVARLKLSFAAVDCWIPDSVDVAVSKSVTPQLSTSILDEFVCFQALVARQEEVPRISNK